MEASDPPASEEALDGSGPPPEDPRAAASALVGTCVDGKYTLAALLGVGALGRVYLAHAVSRGAPLALKLLHDRHAGDALVQGRFAREIQASRGIDHPCVVRVLDAGVDAEGRPYVCMEHVAGPTLGAILRDEELTPRRIASLLCDVLSGLAAAHRQGLVHRDLKPDNILIDRDADGRETARLCDFGVVKVLRQEGERALTLDGMLCGTPEYMAPEQANGRNLDGRVDVYAVGVVLYQMLTRELPFQGRSPVATAAMHATDEVVPPRLRRPGRPVPEQLEAVCMKALQKSPTRRYQTAIEMSEAVRDAVKGLDGRADVPLGSATFGRSLAQIATSAAPERLTIPGAALRSRTRGALGALLLLGASGAIAIPLWRGRGAAERTLSPQLSGTTDLPDPRTLATSAPRPPSGDSGERALVEARRRLRRNDVAGALRMLEQSQNELGDRPDILRVLGEAQIRMGDARKGARTLGRYLEVAPEARDRVVVQALIDAAGAP